MAVAGSGQSVSQVAVFQKVYGQDLQWYGNSGFTYRAACATDFMNDWADATRPACVSMGYSATHDDLPVVQNEAGNCGVWRAGEGCAIDLIDDLHLTWVCEHQQQTTDALALVAMLALVGGSTLAGASWYAGCIGGGGVAMVVSGGDFASAGIGCVVGMAGSLGGAAYGPLGACGAAGVTAHVLTGSVEAGVLACAGSGGATQVTAMSSGGLALNAAASRCVIRAVSTHATWTGNHFLAAAAGCARGLGQSTTPIPP